MDFMSAFVTHGSCIRCSTMTGFGTRGCSSPRETLTNNSRYLLRMARKSGELPKELLDCCIFAPNTCAGVCAGHLAGRTFLPLM